MMESISPIAIVAAKDLEDLDLQSKKFPLTNDCPDSLVIPRVMIDSLKNFMFKKKEKKRKEKKRRRRRRYI